MGVPQYWVDGHATHTIPVDDRGLLLADGAFETLCLRAGHGQYLAFHRARLQTSLDALGFDDAGVLAATVLDHALELVASAECGEFAIVRVTVTRGSGPRGYRPPASVTPRVVVGLFPGAPAVFSPRTLGWSTVAWSVQPAYRQGKVLARTEQVIAAREAMHRGLDDVLMCDPAGNVISSSSANLLARFGGELLAPKLSGVGIAGTRMAVVRDVLAERHELVVREVNLTPEDLQDAEELLLCNTVQGIQSVARLDDRCWEPSDLARVLFADLSAGVGDVAV